jgi:hypothetical protein
MVSAGTGHQGKRMNISPMIITKTITISHPTSRMCYPLTLSDKPFVGQPNAIGLLHDDR